MAQMNATIASERLAYDMTNRMISVCVRCPKHLQPDEQPSPLLKAVDGELLLITIHSYILLHHIHTEIDTCSSFRGLYNTYIEYNLDQATEKVPVWSWTLTVGKQFKNFWMRF